MVIIITEQVPEKLKHKISVLSKGSEQKQSQKTTKQPFSLNGYPWEQLQQPKHIPSTFVNGTKCC